MFLFCLFPYFSGPWADLHQTWWEGKGRPRILARGVHFLKGQGHISVSPRSLGQSSPNLEGRWRAALDIRWRAAPDISLRGSFFERSRSSRSKVKFMGFFAVCSPTSPRSFGRSSPNLVGRLRAAPDINSFFER